MKNYKIKFAILGFVFNLVLSLIIINLPGVQYPHEDSDLVGYYFPNTYPIYIFSVFLYTIGLGGLIHQMSTNFEYLVVGSIIWSLLGFCIGAIIDFAKSRSTKGFVVPLLIGLLVIGAGIYEYRQIIYTQNIGTFTVNNSVVDQYMSTHNSQNMPSAPVVSNSMKVTVSAGSTGINISGMKKYTDSTFGFSFWYPSSWILNENTNVNLGNIFSGGVITKEITVASQQYPQEGIAIDEFYSNGKSITDNSSCGPAEGCPSSVRYYFDSNEHTWMKDSNMGYGQYSASNIQTTVANVSTNSIGGLHILYGNARFGDDVIVPLSASNFLVVRNMSAGTNKVSYLANTITALDPAVANPLPASQQIQAIQTEQDNYSYSAVPWLTYSFSGHSIEYPGDLTVQGLPGGFVENSPSFTFPSSYFIAQNIYEAKINFNVSVGNEPPAGTQVNINGTNWTMTDSQNCSNATSNCNRVVIYGMYGAGNTSWNLSIKSSDNISLSSADAQNIISVFTKMVGSYK